MEFLAIFSAKIQILIEIQASKSLKFIHFWAPKFKLKILSFFLKIAILDKKLRFLTVWGKAQSSRKRPPLTARLCSLSLSKGRLRLKAIIANSTFTMQKGQERRPQCSYQVSQQVWNQLRNVCERSELRLQNNTE